MFHVPESLRNHHIQEQLAVRAGIYQESHLDGAFMIESVEQGWLLCMISSAGGGWEHVSIHARRGGKMRAPTWKEMCQVKDLFWDGEDIVMQLHPKKSEYVNCHPYTLHLWKPIGIDIPAPPQELVGGLL